MSEADVYWFEKDLEELNSEIKRHHELITQLRSYLEWTLQALEIRDVTGSPDDEKYFEILEFLNRNVG